MPSTFLIALRGYDMAQVDQLLARADEALASGDAASRAAARDSLRGVTFDVRMRGYARSEVDEAVQDRLQQLS